jgi:hypothetical protein
VAIEVWAIRATVGYLEDDRLVTFGGQGSLQQRRMLWAAMRVLWLCSRFFAQETKRSESRDLVLRRAQG